MAAEQSPQSVEILEAEQQLVSEQMEQARSRVLPFLRDHVGLPHERKAEINALLYIAQFDKSTSATNLSYVLKEGKFNVTEVFCEYVLIDELDHHERNLVAWNHSLLKIFEEDPETPKTPLPWSVDTLLETAVNCRHIFTRFPESEDLTEREFDHEVIKSYLFHVDQKVLHGLAIHAESGNLSYSESDSIRQWAKRLAHHNLSWLNILEKVQSINRWEPEYQLAAMTVDTTSSQSLSSRAKVALETHLNLLINEPSDYTGEEIDEIFPNWEISEDVSNRWAEDMKQRMADVLFTQLIEPHPELFVDDIEGIHERLMISLITQAPKNQTEWYQKVLVHVVDYAFKNNHPLPVYIPRPNTDF